MAHTDIATTPAGSVRVLDDRVHIEDLDVHDGVLADFLRTHPPAEWAREITKVLAVGVRGITTMGAGATVKGVSEEIERLLASVTADAESRVKEIIESGRRTLSGSLDPDVRSSVTARALAEIASTHQELLARLDLDRTDSHTARLVGEITSLLGPEGLLRQRLLETFDPAADDSATGRLLASIDARFREMRDLIAGNRGREQEAARGTAKGVDYEEQVVEALRGAAAAMGGCTVEATGRVTGGLDARALVGDAVLTLADGTRIAVEAKNTGRITLAGKDGILDELDRALANREASWAICMSKQDSYPAEVGVFGIYGNRILFVDDGEGVLLRVALRWVSACAAASGRESTGVDIEAASGSIDRLRSLAQRFTGAKRALAGVRGSIDQVRGEIDALRIDLLDLVEELHASIRSNGNADTAGAEAD